MMVRGPDASLHMREEAYNMTDHDRDQMNEGTDAADANAANDMPMTEGADAGQAMGTADDAGGDADEGMDSGVSTDGDSSMTDNSPMVDDVAASDDAADRQGGDATV